MHRISFAALSDLHSLDSAAAHHRHPLPDMDQFGGRPYLHQPSTYPPIQGNDQAREELCFAHRSLSQLLYPTEASIG